MIAALAVVLVLGVFWGLSKVFAVGRKPELTRIDRLRDLSR